MGSSSSMSPSRQINRITRPKSTTTHTGSGLTRIYMRAGNVCSSLLNTWVGKKTDKWDPSQSTLLQVLLSIQALILNEKPYFNEPGADHTIRRVIFKKKSQAYNETAFTINCQTMTCLLNRLRKNFRSFIYGHFREREPAILRACNEHVNGNVLVGYYDYNGGSSSSSSTVEVSKNFKEWMQVLYPLFQWLKYAGASLENSVEHLEWEMKGSSNSGEVSDRKNEGILNKVIVKIKNVLAFKNSGKINIACLWEKLKVGRKLQN